MTDINDIMKKAKEMQAGMQKAQEDLANMEVTGEAGGGMVKVTMTGRHDVKKVYITPNLLEDEKEILEDLIAAAINDAVRKVERTARDKMVNLTSEMGLPSDLDLPGTGGSSEEG